MAAKPTDDKQLAWLSEQITRPPFSREGSLEAGRLLRDLQQGVSIGLPHSRPMPTIGPRVHELRINDGTVGKNWRIFYRIDDDAILIIEILDKKTQQTPNSVINLCKKRLAEYDSA